MEHEDRYKPLKESELEAVWAKQHRFILGFIAENGYDVENIFIDKNAVLSVIAKVEQRRVYFRYFHDLDMSEYKEAALNAFWYVKLHPLNHAGRALAEDHADIYDSLNEKLAVYVILRTLRSVLEKTGNPVERQQQLARLDGLSGKYLDELVYSLTYRDLSKESLIMLVESMAVFLGLDPYPAANPDSD